VRNIKEAAVAEERSAGGKVRMDKMEREVEPGYMGLCEKWKSWEVCEMSSPQGQGHALQLQ
jgi:hypothetical protein